jgi:hypothetical protein
MSADQEKLPIEEPKPLKHRGTEEVEAGRSGDSEKQNLPRRHGDTEKKNLLSQINADDRRSGRATLPRINTDERGSGKLPIEEPKPLKHRGTEEAEAGRSEKQEVTAETRRHGEEEPLPQIPRR